MFAVDIYSKTTSRKRQLARQMDLEIRVGKPCIQKVEIHHFISFCFSLNTERVCQVLANVESIEIVPHLPSLSLLDILSRFACTFLTQKSSVSPLPSLGWISESFTIGRRHVAHQSRVFWKDFMTAASLAVLKFAGSSVGLFAFLTIVATELSHLLKLCWCNSYL